MRLRSALALAITAALLAPLPRLAADAAPAAPAKRAADDAVVIAVIDSGFSPYHQDYAASLMPADARPPLSKAPHTWLPGFPTPSSFASYDSLDLTLDTSDGIKMAGLFSADEKQWATSP